MNSEWRETALQRSGLAVTYYSAWTIQRYLQQYEHTRTVFGAITKNQFESIKTVELTPDLACTFDTYALPLDRSIKSNVAESHTLMDLQDTLLPKLVSGGIDTYYRLRGFQ